MCTKMKSRYKNNERLYVIQINKIQVKNNKNWIIYIAPLDGWCSMDIEKAYFNKETMDDKMVFMC